MPRKKTKRKKKKKQEDHEEYEENGLHPETKKGIIVTILFALAGISILALFDLAGVAGEYINSYFLVPFLGWTSFLFPLILIFIGYIILNSFRYNLGISNILGILLFVISLNGLLHLKVPLENAFEVVSQGYGGGYLGIFLSYPLQKIMSFWASLIILAALLTISVLLTFNTSFVRLIEYSQYFKELFSRFKDQTLAESEEDEHEDYEMEEEDEFEEPEEEEEDEEKREFSQKKIAETQAPVKSETDEFSTELKKPKRYKIDIPIDLLDKGHDKPTSGDIKANQYTIQKTLDNFHIPVEMGEISIGPTVTQYTLKPSEGIKLTKITALHNDLALALAAHPIRIEAPIPGKSLVGIEVPNQRVAIVKLREALESKEFKERKNDLTIVLGKDVAGKNWLAQLDRMPHLLVAGATGSGKSVCLNTIIISLLYQNSPETLRLIMVDPKRVELPIYNGIPHLLTPVITDVQKTINALKWTIAEMERRFELLSRANKRNIQSYNQSTSEKMPYIVFIVDELADLMTTAAAEVEGGIIRLAQMARAVGIHLVLATQRPSVDIITGLIKANFPARIAFSVASLMDSRTILDASGAEKLLGRGDMLYINAELSKPKRIQGAFLVDNEIKKVVNFLKEQAEPDYNEEVVAKPKNSFGGNFAFDGDGDELLPEAKEIIIKAGKASASLLQRRLRIGYARAARLLDLLEEQGMIGPADGARPREILITAIEEDLPSSQPAFLRASDSEEEEEDEEIEENEEEEDEFEEGNEDEEIDEEIDEEDEEEDEEGEDENEEDEEDEEDEDEDAEEEEEGDEEEEEDEDADEFEKKTGMSS